MIGDFDIYDILEAYCQANSIYFIPGNNAYVNAVADGIIYDINETILVAELNSTPIYNGGKVTGNSYSGVLALGRKVDAITGEEDTVSSLDETFEQKYKRRLRDLSKTLATLVGEIACENDFEISNVNMKMDINKYDINIDFVAMTITITE